MPAASSSCVVSMAWFSSLIPRKSVWTQTWKPWIYFQENLQEHGFDLAKIPYVLQLNKRDLPSAMGLDDLKRELIRKEEPVFEAVAFQGTGVFETLKEVARLVLTELKKG